MKHIILSIISFITIAASSAQPPVKDVSVGRTASNLLVKMTVITGAAGDEANSELWLRPLITAGSDTLWLQPVVVAGRTRYYQRLRRDRDAGDYVMLRAGKDPDYAYTAVVPYAGWMEQSQLRIVSRTDGCCGAPTTPETTADIAAIDFKPKVYEPAIVYVTPAREMVKTREIHGSAFIDFPVNSTRILEDYRDNSRELSAIRATIDAVRSDKDVTITSLYIKGFASPEGRYAANEQLARGRTEALASYVRDLYNFPPSVMHTSWEAEDWGGLIRWIENHDISNKEAIMALISDKAIDPDRRDQLLKKRYPAQYAMLLRDVYPSLRHSDYTVNYTVRDYATVEEIAAVMATAPQKLSLDELFRLARSYDSNSPEFMEVMEVAVRMYPDSETANLNAALTAASRGETDKARRYLARAGKSPNALYAAGVTEARDGNIDAAIALFSQAEAAGVTEASGEIAKLRALK